MSALGRFVFITFSMYLSKIGRGERGQLNWTRSSLLFGCLWLLEFLQPKKAYENVDNLDFKTHLVQNNQQQCRMVSQVYS